MDDSRRAVERARLANTTVRLPVWHDVPHAFYYMDTLVEAWRCRAEISEFVERVLLTGDGR